MHTHIYPILHRPNLGLLMANLIFQDDRPENSRRSPVCQLLVCSEGRCSSTAIGLPNDGKWVFNMACTMLWCHTVVHFEVTMSFF